MSVKLFIYYIIILLVGASAQKEINSSLPIENYINSFFSAIGGVAAVIFFLIFFFQRLIQGYDKKYDDIERSAHKIKESVEAVQQEINIIKIKMAEHKSSTESIDVYRKDLQQTINDMNRIQGIVQGILRALDQLERGRNSNV